MSIDKYTNAYYQWHVLARGRFDKGIDSMHPKAKKPTAKKTIEEILVFLGNKDRPLSWFRLSKLLGIKTDTNTVYSWKLLRHRPNSYHCLQLLELYKLKHQYPLIDFNNIVTINWDKNVIVIRGDDTIENNSPFTPLEIIGVR